MAYLPMLLATVILAATQPAFAAAPTPATIEAGLAGKWHGALGYRDYQSNELFELAVDTDIRALDDSATVIRVSVFDEGPKKAPALITTASLFTPAGTVTAATLRAGRPVELATDHVTVSAFTDPTHWTMRYEEDGVDGGQPARMRVTETRTGDALLTVKEVLPASATDGVWQFRNQTRLTRVP